MAGLLNLCKKYYGTSNLYEVLNVDKEAKEKEVKKAYYKLSLSIHPDRVGEEDKLLATEKFKVLSQVHNILTDSTKKKNYDETGRVDDESETSIDNWMDYWRQLFKKITDEDIENYEKQYKGSEQERKDVKKAYLRGRGCWNTIHEFVPFLNCSEESRITEIVKDLVDAKEVPEYKVFFNEPEAKRKKRHNKYKREAKSVEKINEKRKKETGENLGNLAVLIQKNNAARSEHFLDSLAEKYASKITKSKQGKGKAKKRLSSTSK